MRTATFSLATGSTGCASPRTYRPRDSGLTVYDALTGSGLDNGQPFPSINTMDRPIQNADGSTDIYFGATSPGQGTNWLATVPGKGWFAIIRLYEPQRAFFDTSWMPGDIVRVG